MGTILRAGAIYIVILVVLRVLGKRTLAQVTTFDFVLLLIISETTQQAMIGEDFSVTGAVLAMVTLLMLDLGLNLLKERWPSLDRYIDGLPLVIVENGKPLHERMKKVRVDEQDVLAAARGSQGLMRMEQIRYAVLERSGEISIIPAEEGKS